MEEKKNAPLERGSKNLTFCELIALHGATPENVANVLGIELEVVQRWCTGIGVPDAKQAAMLGIALCCPLDELYLALLNTSAE